MSRVVVVGGANWDRSWRLPAPPAPGETVVGEIAGEGPGGKGLNVALAAARLGADAALVASLGDDGAGAALRAALEAGGVELSGLQTRTGPSGQAAIWLSPGDATIAVGAGANAALDGAAAARGLDAAGGGCELVVLQAEVGDAALVAAARWAAGRRRRDTPAPGRRPVPQVLLSAAPARALPEPVWAGTDLVVCNRREAAFHSGVAVADPLDAEEAAVALCARGPGVAVVTLGAEGAVVGRPGRATFIPPFTVEVVDAAGAGDCFTGAFAHALLAGLDVFASAGWAMAAAAVCVGRPGTAAAMPTRDEVDRMAHSVDLRRDPGTMPVQLP